MGVSYYVKLGPYIEVKNPPKSSFTEYFGCPNKKCRHYNKAFTCKFCTDCGTAIELVKVPDSKPTEFDTWKETNDRLSKAFSEYLPDGLKDILILMPNKKGLGHHFSAYDSALVPLNETIVLSETKRFESEYAKDIARVREVFGENAVQIKWGVIAYAS